MAHENWYLKVLREGIDPSYEANVSRYVHEVLLRCLDWPFKSIIPQKLMRGFIDYNLTFEKPKVSVRLEVKRFNGILKDEHMTKYLVRRGPKSQDLDVGVLTNLKEWHIYVAGCHVKEATGKPMAKVEPIVIASQSDIRKLRSLIGYRSNGGLKHLRAALGETEAVLMHLLCNDDKVLRAIRKSLFEIKVRRDLEARVPQNHQLRSFVVDLLQGKNLTDCSFREAKLRQALRSSHVAQVANDRLVESFSARNRVGRVHKTIKELVNGTSCNES